MSAWPGFRAWRQGTGPGLCLGLWPPSLSLHFPSCKLEGTRQRAAGSSQSIWLLRGAAIVSQHPAPLAPCGLGAWGGGEAEAWGALHVPSPVPTCPDFCGHPRPCLCLAVSGQLPLLLLLSQMSWSPCRTPAAVPWRGPRKPVTGGWVAHLLSPRLGFFSSEMGAMHNPHRVPGRRTLCVEGWAGPSGVWEGSLCARPQAPPTVQSQAQDRQRLPHAAWASVTVPTPGWVHWEKKPEPRPL